MNRALLLLVAACHGQDAATPCSCTPVNASSIAHGLDGDSLLARLRHHAADVAAGKNPRSIKIDDDELRFAIVDFCRPCGGWIGDRATLDELYPMDRLAEATHAVCLGLVLRDGSTVYGGARACR